MNERPTAVIFDVDGTLCDVRSIRHIVEGTTQGERNFHLFHVLSTGCPPVAETADLWEQAGRDGHARIVVTARTQRYFTQTLWWLLLNGFEPDDMFMRGWKDQRPDGIVKEELLRQIEQRYTVVLAVDDNPSVIEVWERNGIPTVTIPGWGE